MSRKQMTMEEALEGRKIIVKTIGGRSYYGLIMDTDEEYVYIENEEHDQAIYIKKIHIESYTDDKHE